MESGEAPAALARPRTGGPGDGVFSLGAAVPVDRLLTLAAGDTLPPSSTGAALVADISGFSSLAGRLARALGPRLGAEALAETVDAVFEVLIGELHAFGGSVVGFAGDAVTCWFDDRPHGDAAALPGALRAVAAGRALQERMAELAGWSAADDEPLRLSVRVGAAAGPARRFVVGDPDVRLVDVVAGATILRAATAEGLARAGDVVVAPEVAVVLDGHARHEPLPDGGFARVVALDGPVPRAPWPDVSPHLVPEEAVRPWHHPVVLASLVAGNELLADLRLAAILFVRLGELDYDADPSACETLDVLVRAAQRALGRYDGNLLDVAIDAKGTYSATVVGAPLAHPDALARAAAAALELRQAVRAAGGDADLRMGIAAGRVWAGMYGTSARSCYAVRGDPVNLAARLMQKAGPGEILVTGAAAAELEGFKLRVRDRPLELKGQSAPVETASIEGVREAPDARRRASASAPLVGRTAELARLARALEETRAGGSGVLVVRGQPGVGKSRLLESAHERARELGLTLVAGTASPIEQGTPYFALRPLFAELLGIADERVPPDELDRLLAPLGPEAREQAPLLGAVLPVDEPETDATRWMTPEVRQENTLSLLARLFEANRGTEAAVVSLDDAQWLDSASWALLVRLVQTSDRLLLLLGMRPDEPDEATAALATAGATELSLTALAPDDALRLVCRALGVEGLPDAVARFVGERAEGHPFFSLEVAYALRDAGLLVLADGTARLAPGADLAAVEFPETVEGVIAHRVDRLAPQAHALLKVASVLGRTFSEPVLRELDVRALGDRPGRHLAELERLDLVAAEGAGAELTYAFRHVLIRDVVYGRLLDAQRRGLHRRAAVYFEEAGSTPHGVLAHHWEAAGAADRAIDHLEAAGEAALPVAAFRECADFLARALALAEREAAVSPERQARWSWAAAQAHYRLGELAQSRALAESAVAVFDRPLRRPGAAVAAEAARQVVHRLAPGRFVGRAPEDDRPRIQRAVRAYFNLAEVYYLASETTRSAFAAVRALNLAERAGPSLELVEAYGAIAIIGSVVGRHGLAARYGRLGLATAERVGLPYARAIILHQISMARSAAGLFDRAIEDEREAAELFGRLRDRGRVRDSLVIGGVAAYQAGRLDDAERLLTALRETREGGEQFLQDVWAATWLGGVALRRGEPERALELLRAAEARELTEGLDPTTITLPGLRAQALWELGRPEEAAREAERLHALVAETRGRPTSHVVLDGYTALALVAFGLWDAAEAKDERERWADRARDACRFLRTYARIFPTGEPARRLAEGERAWRLGRRRPALASLRRALAAADRLDMRYERWLAHRALAGRLPAGSAEQRRHAEAARLAHAELTGRGAAPVPPAPAARRPA